MSSCQCGSPTRVGIHNVASQPLNQAPCVILEHELKGKRRKLLDVDEPHDSSSERLRLCQQMRALKEAYNFESDEDAIMTSSSDEE